MYPAHWWLIAQVITVIRRPSIVLQPPCSLPALADMVPEVARFPRLKRSQAKRLIQLVAWKEMTIRAVIIFMI